MEETDRYGLFAQYDFELTGASLKNMSSVRSQLSGLEKGIARVADAVNKSDFGRGLEAASRRAQRSTSKAGTEIDELAQSLKLTEKRLKPLKREFRALRAEIRNADFGTLEEKGKFRQAAREVKNYINALKTLESQIEGNTAAEREFAATLKAQQRISQSKLEMQMQQRNAALSAQRVGEFSALRDIGRNALVPINQEIDKGVKLFSSFDDSMASVGAVSGATGKDLEKLRQTAKRLGASTRYTSFQAAEAEKYLATAGFKTTQILGTVSNALELASAGELDLARSADISSNILSGFRLQAEQLSGVVDVLALTSAAANTNIEQLGVAMSYAAPPAALFGASIEETSALIGVMSNAGIQADKAGTAARSAFLRLASPVKQGKEAFAMLGISTTDASGNMRNFIDLMDEISGKVQLDPEVLKQIQLSGGDLDAIENIIPDSKKIEAIKGIFGTTGISGAVAALTQIDELKRLSLANLAASSSTDQLTEYFTQMGVRVAKDQDIFAAIAEQAPDYQTAASLITQANAQLMQSNLQTLSSLQRNKIYDYFKISRDKDLFTEINRSTQDTQKSISLLNTAMTYLGIEMKVETRAARKMAKTMEDNLAGSFRGLASAAEAVYINLIEPLSPIIRFVVDSITKVLLVIANAPYPIRLLIGSVVGLTAAMAATAVAVGTVGFFLFSFSQAAATAAIASQTLSSSLIPLTGFFQSSMLGFVGTNPLETFFQYNTELAEDFQLAWRRTSQRTVGGLEGIYKAIVSVTKATFLLSRAFLLSPITLWVGSFLLLNAFLEQVIPGFNLLGSILSAVTAPLGFIWGLFKGIGQSLMEALGIVGGGTLGVLAAPIHTFTNALNNALETFKSFSDRGEELGLYLGRAIVAPIETASILIDTIWQQVLGGIQIASLLAVMWIQGAWQGFVDRFRQILQPIVTFALILAQQLINALNHNPTERIPEAWHKAVTLIKGYLSDLLTFAQNIGNRIAETGIAIATYLQNLIQSISNTVSVIGRVFRIVGTGIGLILKAINFVTAKSIQGIFLLGKATIWLYKTLFIVGLKALDLLKSTYDKAFEVIQIFRSAFGYGEFAPDDRAIARQTLILGTLNAIGSAFSFIAQAGSVANDVFAKMDWLVAQSVKNFDLLTLALMTAASLPMTLIDMLDESAYLIVPELAILTQPGLFRAFVYALPGIIAVATATGITKGFQRGLTEAIAKLPDQLITGLDWANQLIPSDLRDEVNFALSQIFDRPIDTNVIYLQTRSFLDNQFRAFTEYLLQVGQTIKESGIALRDFLKPFLEYDFGFLEVQTIPIVTTIAPAFKAIGEVLRSPAFAGILQYITFTILPALGQTVLAIAEYLNNIRLILYLPFVSVAVRLIQIVTNKIQLLLSQVVPLSQRILNLSKILAILAVQGFAAFLRTIPYVGNFLANNFLFIVDVIVSSIPIYINLLKRFISIDMLKALIPSYAKVVQGLVKGIVYMFEQGFKPIGQLILKAVNPLSVFKLLDFYIKTQGFKGIIKTPVLSDFFGVLNFINPFDVLFSVSKDLNGLIKMFSNSAELSYDMILKKQTMLFQSLKTNNPAFYKYIRMGAMIPLEELLQNSPGLVRFIVQITRGLMLISPMAQIIGRIGLSFLVWYQFLKPVNEEMLQSIASTEIMGYNLKLLADTIRVLRFLVVDGSDAFIWFARTVPKVINAVVVAFRVLGDTAYYVLHDVIAIGILGFNALKITVINPLVVALIGATAALRTFLAVVQYALKFIRLKTQQYGDAIHQGFGAVMKQIASDVWGVISFIGVQIGNAFTAITSAVHRTWKSLTGLVGAIAHEIYLILVDPVGEFNRLLVLLIGEVNNQIEKTGTLLDKLPFKSVIVLVQKYWKELMFAGGIALQFVKALNPAVRISLLLVDLALTLVYEYETGFKRLDAIIQALSHPIALLDSMIKGMVNFLQGGLIPLDAADWISKFISIFIKMIPTVMGGFFVVALLIKRDIGGAFKFVSDSVMLFIGRIIQAVQAVQSLGHSMNRIYKGDLVQMNLLNAVHGVRSQDNLGPIRNPFAYSQDSIQQQVAVGIGEQRREKAEALLRYQKELDFIAKQEQQRAERELIRQARSGRPELMNPEHSFYMQSPDQPGVNIRMSGAQVEKRRNRFGIEEYAVTDLGRSVMKVANQGYNALRYGETDDAKEARQKAAERSGLSKLYEQYHGAIADDKQLRHLASTGDMSEGMLTRSTLSPLLKAFQDFFENIHIQDFKANELYVGRLVGIKLQQEMMTPHALDHQVKLFSEKSGLNQLNQRDRDKDNLSKYLPTPRLKGTIESLIKDNVPDLSSHIENMLVEVVKKQSASGNLKKEYFLDNADQLLTGYKNLIGNLVRSIEAIPDNSLDKNSRIKGVLDNFYLNFQKQQSSLINGVLADNEGFLDFLEANRRAIMGGQGSVGVGKIATGFDVITQGMTNIRLASQSASNELVDEMGVAQKSLFRLIVDATGIPKMLESLNIDYLLDRQIRATEKRMNRSNRAANKIKRLALYERERGLSAFLENQGYRGANIQEALSEYKNEAGEEVVGILNNWLKEGRFRRGLVGSEKNLLSGIFTKFQTEIFPGFNTIQNKDYQVHDLNSLAKLFNSLVLKNEGFKQNDVQDFVKFLEQGIKNSGSDKGVDEDTLKGFVKKINNILNLSGNQEWSIETLKKIRGTVNDPAKMNDKQSKNILAIFRQAILRDKRFDEKEFMMTVDKEDFAKKLGFRYESQLRKLASTKLKNHLDQIKRSVGDYFFYFEENMRDFHEGNVKALSDARDFLSNKLNLGKIPFLKFTERFNTLIKGYEDFASKIAGKYFVVKDSGKNKLASLNNFFENQIIFTSSIKKALKRFEDDKGKSFEGFLEMVGKNRGGAKVTRRSFQSQFYRQMLQTGINEEDARKVMLSLYRRQGSDKTFRSEMTDLGIEAEKIKSVSKILSQISKMSEEEINKNLIDKKGLNLKGLLPVQFYIAQEIPGILKGMFKDVRTITAKAIKVSKLDKLASRIFVDIASGLQQTIAPKMSTFILNQGRALSGLSLSISNVIRRTVGENFVERWFGNYLAKSLFARSKAIARKVESLGKDSQSITAKLINQVVESSKYLFTVLSQGIRSAANALQNPRSIWASIQGFFGNVKNFFRKLFPAKRPGTLAEVDQQITRHQSIQKWAERKKTSPQVGFQLNSRQELERSRAERIYKSSGKELERLGVEREALTSSPESLVKKFIGLSEEIFTRKQKAKELQPQIEATETSLKQIKEPEHERNAKEYQKSFAERENIYRRNQRLYKVIDSRFGTDIEDNRDPLNKVMASIDYIQKAGGQDKQSLKDIDFLTEIADVLKQRDKRFDELTQKLGGLAEQDPKLGKYQRKSYESTVSELESQRSVLQAERDKNLAEVKRLKEHKQLISAKTSPFLGFMSDLAVLTDKLTNKFIEFALPQYDKEVDIFKNTLTRFKGIKEKVTPLINELFATVLAKGSDATTRLTKYFENAARRSAIAWRRSQREVEGKTWPAWLKAAYRVGKTLVMTLNHGTTDVISQAWQRTRNSATENMQQMVESAHEAGKGIQQGLGQSLEKTEGFFSRLKAGLMDWVFPVRKINRQIEALKPAHQAAKENYESQKVYSFKDERKKQEKFRKFDSLNSQIQQLEAEKEAQQMMIRLSRFMGGLFPGRQFKTPQQYPRIARIALKRFYRRFGNFFGGLFKEKSRQLKLPAIHLGSPRINIGQSMENASLRVVLAWKRAGREIRGKEWPTLIKAAYRVGKTLVNFLNHGAADITSQAWERTQQSSAHSMQQMAETAQQTGKQIQGTFERAINKTLHLFGLLGQSIGNVGKAGMAIGGVVSATGFAAQSVFYSLSNIGLIDEETSQSLYKVTELISIFGAVAGIGTPLLMAFTSSVSALGSIAATAGAAVMGLGRVLSITVGLGASPFAPLVLGIGAVSLAVFGLYKAFNANFMGIRDIIQNTLVVPIEFIQSAWEGFVAKFGGILTPIIKPALDIAEKLINALNHNPTERIPEAWEGAITRIQEMFGWLVAPAQAIAGFLTNTLGSVGGFFGNLFKPKQTTEAGQTVKTKTEPITVIQQGISSTGLVVSGVVTAITTELLKLGFQLSKMTLEVGLFRNQVSKDVTKIYGAVVKSGTATSALIQSIGFAAIGKAIAVGMGGTRLFTGIQSLVKIASDVRKDLGKVVKEKMGQYGIKPKGVSTSVVDAKQVAKNITRETLRIGADIGTKLRPIQGYLPALGLLFPELSMAGMGLIGLSYVFEKIPSYLATVTKLLPIIGAISAATAGFLVILEIATKDTNVLGTLIGGIAFVVRGVMGFFRGISQSFKDTFKNIPYIRDLIDTVKRLGQAGEDLGYNLGYSLTQALLDPINTIKNAWLGFSEWFSNLPLVSHALNIATGLINALNHNPTERIPEAWDVATNRISGMLDNTVTIAQQTGKQMTTALSSGVNNVKSGAIAVRDTSVNSIQNMLDLKPTLEVQNQILAETRKVVEQAIVVNEALQGINNGINTIKDYVKPVPVTTPAPVKKERVEYRDKNVAKGWSYGTVDSNTFDEGRLISATNFIKSGLMSGVKFAAKLPIKGLDFFQKGEASIRNDVSNILQSRQNEIIKEMADKSQSSSLALQSEYSKYITKGAWGEIELTKEGQIFLETKLAKEYRDRKGVFSSENLQQIATRTGKTSDQIYDIGLQGQPIIRDAIKSLPDKEKSLAEKIAPQIDRVVQVIDQTSKILSDILNELNTILVHVVPITASMHKIPSQLQSTSESPVNFLPSPQPKQSLWDKITNYFHEYYAKTKVKYKIPQELTEPNTPVIKNNIVPYRPKSVGDVVNPIIQEKTSKFIPFVQQKASELIPAAQQTIGGLAQRWQKHRKSKPVVDDLVTNGETEWNDKESWWEKNFKSIRESWGDTVSVIQSGVGKLIKKAPDQGYELQKGLSEGSPGPTFYIRKYWKKTIDQVTDWMGDLVGSAAKTGVSLAQSLGVGTVKTAIAVTPFVSESTKTQAIQNIEAGLLSIQDRYDYLKAQGFGNLGILFEPGAEQVTDALQLLGGDIADFAKRSVKALLTLNLGELAQASKDFGGNLAFALKGLTAGFNSMGLSAIAAGAAVLTGMAPAIITVGAIAFGAAVILANFLGIRSILKGVIQILIATGKIAFFTFMAAGRVLKGFSLILRGLFGDSELVKQGIAEIKDAFQILGQQLKLEFKAIAQGFGSIGHGLKVALLQIFPFLKQPLEDLRQWFDEFWSVFALSPEWAGRMAAEALIDFVKNTFRVFNNLRLSVVSIWQKTMTWFQIKLWEVQGWVVEVFRKIARLDFSFLQDIPNLLLQGFKQVAEKIPNLFNRTGEKSANRILQPIQDGFQVIAEFIKGFSDRINEELQLVFPGWMKSLGQSLIPLFDSLYQGVSRLRQGIFDLAVQWVKLAVGFNLPMGYTVFEFLDNLLKRFQSTVVAIEKAWLKFFVNAGKLEWNQITEDIGNALKTGFKTLTISVGQFWNQLWSTVLEAPTLKGKIDAFMSNFSFLSILNYVDDVAIAFDRLREKVGQVTSWLSNLIGTWNQLTDKTPKLQLDIDTASLETKANNLIDKVQGKWNQLVKFFENPKWPTARQTWQGLLNSYEWLRSQFRTITAWFGRTPEILAPLFDSLKNGADKVSDFLFNMELQWTKLSIAFNLPLPYKLFEFINKIPELFKAGVIQIETSWKWLANEIAGLNWKTLTHVWNGFSKLFGLLGTSLDLIEGKWREFQAYILTSPQLVAPIFEKLRKGLEGFSDRVVNLSEKWENFATRFHLPKMQGFFTELFALSENFQGVLTGIEDRWEKFATWLGTTNLFSNILGGLKNLSFAFGAVTGFIGRHWNKLIDFLRSTRLLVHLGNGVVLLIEFIDNLSTHINNLKQRWSTFLEANETTVARIKKAWEGFTENFKKILQPIVDFALNIAEKLINALNHNPTERIPEAWRKAVDLIQSGLSGLLNFAKDIGKRLISALIGKENTDKLFGNIKEIKDNFSDLVDPVRILEGVGQGVVSAFNLLTETLPKLLNPMKLFNDLIEASNYAMGIMSLSIPEQIPIWKSLFVVIGDNLVSAFKQLDQVFVSVLSSLEDAVPGLKPFLDVIDLAKDALQSLVGISTKFSFEFSFGFLEGFVTKLEKINQTFSEFNEPLEKISKSFKDIFLFAKENIPQAFSEISKIFRPIVSSVDEFVSGITLTEKIGQNLGAIFADSLNLAVGGVKNAIKAFAELLDAIAHPIQTVEKLGDVIKSVPSEAWKVVVEVTEWAGEQIKTLFTGSLNFVSQKFDEVTQGIGNKFRGMFDGIKTQLGRFTGATKAAGQQTEADLSHNSPGPTYMIRKKWFEMLEMIEGRVQGFTTFTRQQGQQIQSAMTTSPQISLANQISQYGQLTEKLSKVARLQNEINQRRKTDSSEPFNRAAGRATVKLDRARTQILQEQSTLIESLKQSDLVSPRHLSQLDKQQARLNEITLAQQNLNQRIEAGNISKGNAQGRQAKLDRQQIQALERQSALIQEIEQAQTASGQHLGGGLRGTLISMGSLLSNFAPQLSTPLFLLNDFIDAFTDIRGLLPSLQAGMVAWGTAIASSNSFVAGTFTLLKGAALKAYTTLITPLLPFLPIILGVVAAVGLFYLAFKSNFLGIRDLIYGIGWAFKKFFGDLLGGFFTAIGSIFTTFDQEVRAIANLFGELVYAVVSIFDPILKLFNVDVRSSVLSISDVLSALVNVILFPIRVFVKSLVFWIKVISWGIQLIIKSLIFTVNVVKSILWFAWELVKAILIISATVGVIIAIMNFGAVLAGVVGTVTAIGGVIASIGGIISGIISGILFITPFLAAGLAGVATVVGGAIASAAVALAPIIAGIAVVVGIAAVIIGIAFVIKKIFEGIWWVISSIAKGIWYIITNPMQAFSAVATFVQNVFSGISSVITGLINGLKSAGSFIGSLFSKIGQGINIVVGWIMAPVNLLVNSISSLFNLLSNPLGFLSNIPLIGGFFGGQPKTEKPPGYATGGLVKGPGTGTGDRVHAKLSPGEYVINAIAARANLPLLHAINKAKAGMMPIPQITALPAFAPIPFFPPVQTESVGEQEININLNFGDIIVQGETGEDVYRDFLNKLRSPQAKMEIRQIMREFVERMR